MTHSLHGKVIEENVILKVDMAKAYDVVDWHFLQKVMAGFRFSTRACNLIANCVESPWFSVMMNGTYSGFFHIQMRSQTR